MDIKTVLSLAILLLTYFVGASQNTFVPDDNFEQALINLGYDAGPLDDFVPTATISAVTNLDINNLNISELTGIEDFTALTALDCSFNNISNIDITQNLDLQILWCFNNLLTTVNVTKNPGLISLVCHNNFITNLNLVLNPNLNVLVCNNNLLTNLDITKNTVLSRVQCGYNFITSLNVSNNTNLSFFTCENNGLSTLDLRVNTNLSVLNCAYNQLEELDVSNNPSLSTLNCSNNNLCRFNIKNSHNTNVDVNFSSNLNLNCVVVDNPLNNHSTWIPANFSNYVSSQANCSDFVNIDTLSNVITNSSYTLPELVFGNYYTASQANGTPLFAGNTITSSQTIYIYNESICASNESSFYVLITDEDYYIPKYFTPNNDGNHDVWKVEDFTNTIKNIRVFDRYGKLLKSLQPNAEGWNGTYLGQLLESNDYWYVITLQTGDILKGHFSLKR